jgi:hypothetical protein
VLALQPEDLEGDEAVGTIVNKLGTVDIKAAILGMDTCKVNLESPDGNDSAEVPALSVDAPLYSEHGVKGPTIGEAINFHFRQDFAALAKKLGLGLSEAETRTLKIVVPNLEILWPGSESFDAYIPVAGDEPDEPAEFWRLTHIKAEAELRTEIGEIPLAHKKLDGLSAGFAFGEGTIGGDKATFIVDESRDIGRMIIETTDGAVEGSIKNFAAEPVDPAQD